MKVQGILTGSPYPELQGSYSIVSSSGYTAVIDFSGKRMLGLAGQKNHMHAAVYAPEDKTHKEAIYDAEVCMTITASVTVADSCSCGIG